MGMIYNILKAIYSDGWTKQLNDPGQAIAALGIDGLYHLVACDAIGNLSVTSSGGNIYPTYTSAFSLLAVAGAGNAVEIIGSATKVVKIQEIVIFKPDVEITLLIRKQSTASTGGTSTVITAVPHDAADAAASAVVRGYTAEPTPGTLIGGLAYGDINIGDWVSFKPSAKAWTLNAVAQSLAINVDGAVNLTGTITWTEQ